MVDRWSSDRLFNGSCFLVPPPFPTQRFPDEICFALDHAVGRRRFALGKAQRQRERDHDGMQLV